MFIDANVFLAAFLDSQEQGIMSKALMAKVAKGEQNAITNVLVVNEVLYIIKGKRGLDEMKSAYRVLISYSHLSIMPIDEKTVAQSMQYMDGGLEVSDAFHAATMKMAGVGTICSYDPHFDKAKGIKRKEP